jgi:NAD-dependent deacetylase
MEAASLSSFRTAPEKFYAWFRPLAGRIIHADPNPAHKALAELERAGRLHMILTQNIDILHQKAGAMHVVELHGSIGSMSCTQCFQKFNSGEFILPFIERGEIPRCRHCGAALKPDVILFGEQLPQKAWFEAQREARQCDLMIVAGSSLEVLPVAGLPLQALERGAHLIIVNNTPTYLNVRADLVFLEDVAQVLPAIAERVLHG